MKTPQEIFNDVLEAAKKMKRRAGQYQKEWDGVFTCEYETCAGDRCFIGALMPGKVPSWACGTVAELLDLERSGSVFEAAIKSWPFYEIEGFSTAERDLFLTGLQAIHDSCEIPKWKNQFRRFAKCWGLAFREDWKNEYFGEGN